MQPDGSVSSLANSPNLGVGNECRLTKKGIGLYPVPLAMLTWGDRWLASGARGIQLTHRPCAHTLDAVLGCGHGSAPVTRSEIEFVRTPV